MRRPSVRLMLLVALGLATSVPLVLLGLWHAHGQRAQARAAAQREDLRAAQTLARELAFSLKDTVEAVESAAQVVGARGSLEPAALQPLLALQRAAHPELVALGVADRAGRAFVAEPAVGPDGRSHTGIDYSDRDYYRELVRTGQPTLTRAPVRSRITGRPALVAAAPARPGATGAWAAYTYGSFELSRLEELVRRAEQELPGARALVSDAAGRPVLGGRADAPLPLFRPAAAAVELREGADEDGVAVQGAAAQLHVRGLAWTVVVVRPAALAEAAAVAARREALAFAGVALVGGLALAALFAAWLARPVAQLARAAARLGAGDFSQALVPPGRLAPRELAALHASFRGMTERLRVALRSLAEAQSEVAAVGGTLGALIQRQSEVAGVQGQALARLDDSASGVQRASEDAAARARQVLEVAARADAAGAHGRASLHETQARLGLVQDVTAALADGVRALLAQTAELGTITETVNELADQSSIVALNAALEAAKAGEQGAAFSVVAREMRELAQSSLQSTARIRELLASIERAIQATADASAAGTQRVQAGLAEVRTSGERLQELTGAVEEAGLAVRAVAAAVQEQHRGIGDISDSVRAIRQGVGATAEGISQTERAARELAETSARLGRIVAGFRL